MQANKQKWDFSKIQQPDQPAAMRVTFIDIGTHETINEMLIRIPEGGRCDYFPSDRMFYIFDSEGEVFREVHAPENLAVDISFIEKEYLDILDHSNLESYQANYN
jgi:hypothetical protein